jgi:hypothetical protein
MGWRAGQIVDVGLADRNCTGQYIVQEVQIEPYTSDHWMVTVTAGGALLGLADFIAGLSKKQKTQRPTEEVVLNKTVPTSDSLVLTDSVITSSSAPGVGTPEVGHGEVGSSYVV